MIMGAWNTFSFENDLVYDAFSEAFLCSTLFNSRKHEMTLIEALNIVTSEKVTNKEYIRAKDYLKIHEYMEDFEFAGIVIIALYHNINVPLKDITKAITTLETEYHNERELKKWSDLYSRKKRILEELEYLQKARCERG